MRIECVIVCVRYSDFLCWTLPYNKHHFDEMVVITDSKDVRTRKLCEYHHVRTIVTDSFYEGGARFNKAKGINEGLRSLRGDGLVVHMDADIYLPPLFRSIVQSIRLDPHGLYHIDRMMCDSFRDWLRFLMRPDLQHEANIYVHPRPFPMGVRLAGTEHGGWLPLGFFQMWDQGRLKLSYPENHTDAGRTDLLFTKLFPREHRHMLAEVIGIHLETRLAEGKMGSNWGGRKTPEFGADLVGPADTPPPEPAPDGPRSDYTEAAVY